MKVGILGGGSCFAMNLSTHLIARGDEVLSISRSPMQGPAFTLGLENEPRFQFKAKHLVCQLDETMELLDDYRPEIIVNFAALCDLAQSWITPEHYYETNLMAMCRLVLQLQERTWLRRFVQAGTSELYGSVTAPATEESPIRCSSPYAASKAVFDLHLIAVAKHQAFPAVIVRPSNGYCEGQALNRIIPKTILCALNGTRLKLQGGGISQKSYLHADDISSAIMLLMEKGAIGGVYNCGPEHPISIRSIVGALAEALGKQFSDVAEVTEERLGQDSMYRLDSSKIRAGGWEPKVSISDGFDRMISWVRRYPELLTAPSTYEHRP